MPRGPTDVFLRLEEGDRCGGLPRGRLWTPYEPLSGGDHEVAGEQESASMLSAKKAELFEIKQEMLQESEKSVAR
jgi:hypothetical protein